MKPQEIYIEGKKPIAARTMLDACRELQDEIANASTSAERAEMIDFASLVVRGMNKLYSSRTIIAKSRLGIIIPGMQREAEKQKHLEFDDLLIKGWLGRISFMEYKDWKLIIWPVYEAKVLNETEYEIPLDDMSEMDMPHMPIGRESRLPVYLPVALIDYALWSK